MTRKYYDLHIHSCLSPCGDDDNTPNNIVGMASLCGIDILALTDHNSCKNCPAFFEAAEKYGITPIAGIELTTSEDIHVVCLFEHLQDAIRFDEYVSERLTKIKNRPEFFGNQSILNENDESISTVDNLLIVATSISVSDVKAIVEGFGGVCYPAHIDRDSNGIIAILGTLPEDTLFDYYELRDKANIENYSMRYGIEEDRFIVSSDAHYLTDISDKDAFIEFDTLDTSSEAIRAHLFEHLRRKRT